MSGIGSLSPAGPPSSGQCPMRATIAVLTIGHQPDAISDRARSFRPPRRGNLEPTPRRTAAELQREITRRGHPSLPTMGTSCSTPTRSPTESNQTTEPKSKPVSRELTETQPLVSDDPLDAESIECESCGLLQRNVALQEGQSARCARCGSGLRHCRRNSIDRTLALSVCGLILFVPANVYAILSFSAVGRSNSNQLTTGVLGLFENNAHTVGVLVLMASFLAPLLRFLMATAVLLPIRLGRSDLSNPRLQRIHDSLGTWAMLDVYLFAIVVAYAKLSNFGASSLNRGWYPLLGLILVSIAVSFVYDPEAVRRARSGGPESRIKPRPIRPGRLQTTEALLVGAAILLPFAYTLPVMRIVEYGDLHLDTVYGAVLEFTEGGQYSLAILMFCASILIPIFKLILMGILVLSVRLRWTIAKRERLIGYKIVETIGRWSFIDLFVVSILIALAELGVFANAMPGPGLLFFASVVVLTMFAAISFDPRLIWSPPEK